MDNCKVFLLSGFTLVLLYILPASLVQAKDQVQCEQRKTLISFIQYPSADANRPELPLVVQGKLKIPTVRDRRSGCAVVKNDLPAVVILHGSAGVDFRGDFYARALNSQGVATLEIDMWEARGITGVADRPPVPLVTYPDAFGALTYLAAHPNIDARRIGVLGFSWGGVMAMASATELYATQFGRGLRFAAHVAHYPVCYGYNNPNIPGSEFNNLTGAPVMIQIGEDDDYDHSSAPCKALKASLPLEQRRWVHVVAYPNASHAWDRLQVPISAEDPFAHLGAGGTVTIVPNPEIAQQSRTRVARFFRRFL